MSYKQLTEEKRYQISALLKANLCQKNIATIVGCHASTICRELGRNRGHRGYRPRQAHDKATQRKVGKSRPRLDSKDWSLVEALLRKEWSPEQIFQRLKIENKKSISHEWIYCYIIADKANGGSLYRHLRCKKKRRKRYGSYDRRGTIPNQVSIDERPKVVDARSRIGDWEGDTMVGKNHKGVLVTMVERKTGYTLIEGCNKKASDEVTSKIVKMLKPSEFKVHTITLDNGREFAGHKIMGSRLKASVYFAHPYSSWERGTNENTNGLIRQYFPKNRILTNITKKEINEVLDKLNNRPRKRLGYKTPYEVIFKKKTKLTEMVALTT